MSELHLSSSSRGVIGSTLVATCVLHPGLRVECKDDRNDRYLSHLVTDCQLTQIDLLSENVV